MKNAIRLFALVALMGFTAAACSKAASAQSASGARSTIPEIPGMVWIPAGTFTMGSPETEPERLDREGPQHQVTLTKGFYMGKYPVTQEQYEAVMGTNPSRFKTSSGADNPGNRPVEQVSWYDAIVFCNRLSMNEGLNPAYRISGSTNPSAWGNIPTNSNNAAWNAVEIVEGSNGYRLPTEAQWEYACRAGTTTPFNTGDNITAAQANYDGNYPYNGNPAGLYRERTIEVGSFEPNAWGLYDMHGNVLEWCWDWYGAYESGAQIDPTGAVSGSDRVERGGPWYRGGQVLRSAFRHILDPGYRGDYIGFRLSRP